ncbi:MAG: two-partner secretion domain-containing protein [Phycisphaerales bacterium]
MTTQDMNDRVIRSKSMLMGLVLSAGLCTGFGTQIASATPEGGDVVEGEADIDYGDWTRVVTGEITVIEWLSFQIAAGETVEFIMPSENSRVLNLINSGVPTEIMGTLIGNGQVFLVNPSGVIFGQGAVVNVGALYAAAGHIDTNDFLNGVYRFTDARGVVENRGHLEGDLIALVGGRVANHGTISAPGGTVIMAAGEQVLIGEHLGHVFVQLEKPTDLENTDLLSDPGGEGIDLAAGDVFSLAAWNTGTIEAEHATVAVSAGHMAIDNSITAGDITLDAIDATGIELGADITSDGGGIFILGDLVLTDDVQMTMSGDHGTVAFKGTVDSTPGDEHDLRIDAGNGLVTFRDSVGQSDRLGVLDVTGGRVQFFDDVAVNQEMNFYAPVEIMRDSTTFDVGFGSALFGDILYSHADGASDVAFVYDGQAWVGQGEARTPFQFREGIGVGPTLSTGPASGAFGNIRFGGDLSDPSRVSAFVFGAGAQAGLDLMNSADTDLSHQFQVNARESIVMGQGQKMLSFGSLSLNAKGRGATTIAIGDINVLGDLRVISQGSAGGTIELLTRSSGEVDYTGNESDRDLDGLVDEGMELIASGSIVLDGDLAFSGDVTLGSGSNNVLLLNNTGSGDAGGLDIGLYPDGVSLDLFRGLLSGTGDLLYPYDLTLPPASVGPQAELATAFASENSASLRTDRRYLAAREILAELSLGPVDPSLSQEREMIEQGATRFDSNSASAFGVTIDRLTRRSVNRLSQAYVSLLGERHEGESTERVRRGEVMKAVGWLWLQTNGRDIDSIHDYAQQQDPDGGLVLDQIQRVLEAIGLLELTPLEIQRAQMALLSMIKPVEMPMEVLTEWFGL